MSPGAIAAAVAAVLVVVPTGTALAQARVTVSGYATASYSYNTNRPASALNQLRVFDFDDRKLKLDLVELVVQRAIAKPDELGFRVDADAGQSMPRITAATGLFRSQDGKSGNFDLRQVIVSYIAPIGRGLRLDAGKFVTHIGLDVIDGVDGSNQNATRGFLFGFGEPYTHTGVKASYPISPAVTAMALVTNGWDVVRDNNHATSFGAQLAFAPAAGPAVAFNVMAGPERSGQADDSRLLANIVGTWKASKDWSLGIDVVWGTEPNAAGQGVDGRWTGTAVSVRRTITGSFALVMRGEVFDDAGGDRTGVAQTLSAITLTPELTLTRNLFVRADLRLDHSTARVFEKGTERVESQPTLLVGAVAHF